MSRILTAAVFLCGLLGLSGASRACLEVSNAPLVLHPPIDGDITLPYGDQKHPLLNMTRVHVGVDYAARLGASVMAAAPGVVIIARRVSEYGNLVAIRHPQDTVTRYGHLSRVDVSEGDCVSERAVIGGAGSTGLVADVHVHFEVLKDSQHVDPLTVLVPGLR